MNIILGASGQIGSRIIDRLYAQGINSKAVIRDSQKAIELRNKGLLVDIADYTDYAALNSAFKGGSLAFVITPENMTSTDAIGDTQELLNNYRKAIEYSGIQTLIGLSSLGAQHKSGTGNIRMSYMLEHAFTDMSIIQVYVRPAYYFSNWLFDLPIIREHCVLSTFFPVDLKIPMISPTDVADYITDLIAKETHKSAIYELVGPRNYSANDVAMAFSAVLNKNIEAQQSPRESWEASLKEANLADNTIRNVIEMTEAVINGKTIPEKHATNLVTLDMTLEQYLRDIAKI